MEKISSVFPEMKSFSEINFNDSTKKRLLITSEGFEERSLVFVNKIFRTSHFENSIICKYYPVKKSRLNELKPKVKAITINKLILLEFSRYDPFIFEEKFNNLSNTFSIYDEIIIDISVMSKLLICIIINCLKEYKHTLRIIYTEPSEYCPSEEEYDFHKNNFLNQIALPSFGVHDVVRTPGLSSVIMQRAPSIVIAFLSFNEQLIRALLNSLNPARLLLINGIPPSLSWRESATLEIHHNIINEYLEDNSIVNGKLLRSSSTLNVEETFSILASIYNENCYCNRIILSPTGSKMQSVACAFMKIICPDIHIEYPTPESFVINGYSSQDIKEIHEIEFPSFCDFVHKLSCEYDLNF